MSFIRKEHQVIEVEERDRESVIVQNRGRRALTLDKEDIQGQYVTEEEEEIEDQANANEEEVIKGEEHTYSRGRQAIPMESPGDDIRKEALMLNDQDDGEDAEGLASVGVQRLRRLQGRRGFFHSNDNFNSFRYRSNGGILQRIILQRRKREDSDVFWTAIGVLTLLSFAFMCCITIYLTQTDFFESHQNDLFGTTVDNRFTVVAHDDAEIFLKSGYSNSVFSEGMMAFNDGKLRIGRRSFHSGETQKFHGVSFLSNGTALFTNRVESPMIEADYLSARKGIQFGDGTMMTTASGSLGRAEEEGDLNLVSKTGSVVTSAGGEPLLFVDPAGTVTVANTKSDELTSGIILDGTLGQIRIGNDFVIKHKDNLSTLSTPQALHLKSSSVFVGTSTSGKVRISVPAAIDSGSDDDDDNRARALRLADDAEESESVILEVSGQTSLVQKEGGDIRIMGGDGLNVGGDVILVGGQANASGLEYGSVTINAGLHPTDSSLTEIGSHGSTHEVTIHGLVSFNHISSMNDTTKVKVGGGRFDVSSQRIALDNRATNLSELHVNSNNIHLGSSSPLIQVGKMGLSRIKVQGSSLTFDATKSVTFGKSASSIGIGDTEISGQKLNMKSSAIQLDASRTLSINTVNREAMTTISGLVHFNGSSNTSSLLSITGTAVMANPTKFRVGAQGKTSVAIIEATHVTIGGHGAKATVLPPPESKLNLFSSSITIGSTASGVLMRGKSVVMDSTDTLTVGDKANEITIGSKDVGNVSMKSKTLSMAGATTIKGVSLAIQSSKVDIGGKSTSDITIGAVEANVDIGSQAKLVSIGVDSTTVNIGSDATVVNLSGSVKINGKDLDSRRLAVQSETENKPFGYLNADRVAVSVTQTEALTPFAPHWDTGYSSESYLYQVNTNQDRMLSIVASVMESDQSKVDSKHFQISLRASSVVLVVQGENAAVQTSKIRCQVYRHAAEVAKTIAMEVSALIEHCSGTTCENGIFLGLQGQQIVPYRLGDSFSTQCTVASSASGELLLQNIQFSFTEQ
ncbi:unnamed protein product [Peronospora belbahrii]|uniref:Uncharacterized protein n=1 Tax=Peronospora belbahrii TaxID=622444 RepID=A0ABN8D9Z6_9STRA|nr:unnamed protein product [Peronospora belbahrii]